MKFSSILIALAAVLLFSSCHAIFVSEERERELRRIIKDLDLLKTPGGPALVSAAIREIRGVKSCDPNVCFAIDGSGSLGKPDFDLQKQFVAIVAAIVGADPGAEFAAVQYGLVNRAIRNLRGNPENFLLTLERSRFQRARRTFIGAGLSYCVSQLGRRRGEPSKIVLLGDGRSTYGDVTGPLSPAAISKAYLARSPANKICTVAVGFSDTSLFKDIVGGKQSLVLEVTDWQRVLNILRGLIRDICLTTPVF